MAVQGGNALNFDVTGEVTQFFGFQGMKRGDTWYMTGLFGLLTPVVHIGEASLLPDIAAVIATDVAAGNGDKVAQLQLGPQQAMILFLEGVLRREHFDSVTEGVDFIDVPKVEMLGRTLTVRILRDPEHIIATADAEGNIL